MSNLNHLSSQQGEHGKSKFGVSGFLLPPNSDPDPGSHNLPPNLSLARPHIKGSAWFAIYQIMVHPHGQAGQIIKSLDLISTPSN